MFSYPVKLILSKYGFSVLDSNTLGISYQQQSLYISFFCSVLFLIPALFFHKVKSPPDLNINKHNLASLKLIIIIFGIFVLLSNDLNAIKSALTLQFDAINDINKAKGAERQNSSFKAIFSNVSTALITVFCYNLANTAKKLFSMINVMKVLAIGFFMLLVTSSKMTAIYPIAAYVISVSMIYVNRGGKINYFKIILSFLLFLVLTAFAGFIRAITSETDFSVAHMALIQLLNAFDMPDNFAFILSRINDFWLGDRNLSLTWEYLFVAFIPRFLWPDKPDVFGNMSVMRDYFFERYGGFSGEVLSPSMPGEMMVSGGMIFLIMWSLIVGSLYYIIVNKAYYSKNKVWIILYIWSLINLVNLLRSGSGVLGSMFFFYICLLGTICLFKYILKKDLIS